jgi:hypothetical protein
MIEMLRETSWPMDTRAIEIRCRRTAFHLSFFAPMRRSSSAMPQPHNIRGAWAQRSFSFALCVVWIALAIETFRQSTDQGHTDWPALGFFAWLILTNALYVISPTGFTLQVAPMAGFAVGAVAIMFGRATPLVGFSIGLITAVAVVILQLIFWRRRPAR